MCEVTTNSDQFDSKILYVMNADDVSEKSQYLICENSNGIVPPNSEIDLDSDEDTNSSISDRHIVRELGTPPLNTPFYNPSVSAMLKKTVESIDAFILKQHRPLSQRKKPKIERTIATRRNRLKCVDSDPETGNWYGCKVSESKKFERLSLASWRHFNRILHYTQQSLKHFNIRRIIYKPTH